MGDGKSELNGVQSNSLETVRDDAMSVKDTDSSVVPDSDSETQDKVRFHGCYDVKIFLFLLCLLAAVQGFAINGVNNVNIPMLERRFRLTSTETGIEASFYDMSAVFVTLIVGYFISQYHQPRVLAISAVLLAVGSLTMALPHFIVGEYQPSNSISLTCLNSSAGNGTDDCLTSTDSSLSNYLYLFLGGQFFHGLAGAILYTLGTAYIDGSVASKDSAQYLALFQCGAAIGASIGYLAGGAFTEIYVDFPKSAPSQLTANSPAWVGAWWIGFLISSLLCAILSIPISRYPRILPGTEERLKRSTIQTHDTKHQHLADSENFGKTFRDIPMALFILLRNPAFIGQCFVGAFEGILLSGTSTFLPKFVANQFAQKASTASIATGCILVPGALFGQICGGVIIRRFNWKVKQLIKWNISMCILGIAVSSIFWLQCDDVKMAGVTHSYINTNIELDSVDLTSSCNAGCGCDTWLYKPVCMDGVQYFSPCHAGCSQSIKNKEDNYTACQCHSSNINTQFHSLYNPSYNSTVNNSMSVSTVDIANAREGKCSSNCVTMMFGFLAVSFLGISSLFSMSAASSQVVLRSVNKNQRALAMSIQQIIMRLVGTIPGPLLFGFVMDRACLVWQKLACSEKNGSCWIYSGTEMGQNFFILFAACKVGSIIVYMIIYRLYKPPKESSMALNSNTTSSDDLDFTSLDEFSRTGSTTKL